MARKSKRGGPKNKQRNERNPDRAPKKQGRKEFGKGKGKGKNTGKEQFPPVIPLEDVVLPEDALSIDGSVMEGGGQVIRQSTAFAAILGKPIELHHIRAGRRQGGLRAQHLTGVLLVSSLCGGQLAGAELHSSHVKFLPGPDGITGGDLSAKIPTAGSLTLLMQVSLPPLLFAASGTISRVQMMGGTNAIMAPQIDYCQRVFLPIARRMGVNADVEIQRRGFFPKGQGRALMTVHALEGSLSPLTMTDRGEVVAVTIYAFTAGKVPAHVGERMCESARKAFDWFFDGSRAPALSEEQLTEEVWHEGSQTAVGNAACIMCVAETSTGCLLAGSEVGKVGVKAEKVGHTAAHDLIKQLEEGGCVDEHLQDQLIILMALADGVSSVRAGADLTMHTQTAIHFAEHMTGASFVVEVQDDGTHLIQCEGIAHARAPSSVHTEDGDDADADQ